MLLAKVTGLAGAFHITPELVLLIPFAPRFYIVVIGLWPRSDPLQFWEMLRSGLSPYLETAAVDSHWWPFLV